MNQKGFANIIVVIGVIIVAGIAGYFVFNQQLFSPPSLPVPTPSPIPAPPSTGKAGQIEFAILDILTAQPISDATVIVEQVVECPEIVGYSCPKGLTLSQQSDSSGKVIFSESQFVKDDFSFRVSAKQYRAVTGHFLPSKDKLKVIKLIGGTATIQTDKDATNLVESSSAFQQWKQGVTQTFGVFQETALTKTALLDAPFWKVAISIPSSWCVEKGFSTLDARCTFGVKVDMIGGKTSSWTTEEMKKDVSLFQIDRKECVYLDGYKYCY
jgi:hypothetical protein